MLQNYFFKFVVDGNCIVDASYSAFGRHYAL